MPAARRENQGEVCGYQRPEVLSHIAEIRKYLECSDPMIPNAVVIAFDERVRFEPAEDPIVNDFCRAGVLMVPVEAVVADHEKPGWIVDGQQRMAAIREASISSFPIPWATTRYSGARGYPALPPSSRRETVRLASRPPTPRLDFDPSSERELPHSLPRPPRSR
jgi:hypothetical protein